jgi:hypothetical protein
MYDIVHVKCKKRFLARKLSEIGLLAQGDHILSTIRVHFIDMMNKMKKSKSKCTEFRYKYSNIFLLCYSTILNFLIQINNINDLVYFC